MMAYSNYPLKLKLKDKIFNLGFFNKLAYLESLGFYFTISGNLCDNHLRTITRDEVKSSSLNELRKRYGQSRNSEKVG